MITFKSHEEGQQKMSIKKLVLLMGLSALFAGCSTGRYAADDIKPAKGETVADVGRRYLLGRGVPQNDVKAFYYFNQAANNDDPFAENEVAYLYAAGKGTPRNYEKAFVYYEKAANHGLASAQYNLGLLYLYGLGTQSNRALAIQWFQKAADHGFLPAQQQLKRLQS